MLLCLLRYVNVVPLFHCVSVMLLFQCDVSVMLLFQCDVSVMLLFQCDVSVML